MTRKIVASLVFIVAFVTVSAQEVNKYHTLLIKDKFSGKHMNSYNLQSRLINSLKGKDYVVLKGSLEDYPQYNKGNECQALIVDLLNASTFLKNRVRVEFKNCRGDIVAAYEGGSDLKDYEEGYQEALKNALKKLKNSSGQSFSASTIVSDLANSDEPVVEKMTKKDITMELKKIILSEDHFILVQENSSTPFATFYSTMEKGIYKVVLDNKETAFAFEENGNLILEVPQKDGSYIRNTITVK